MLADFLGQLTTPISFNTKTSNPLA